MQIKPRPVGTDMAFDERSKAIDSRAAWLSGQVVENPEARALLRIVKRVVPGGESLAQRVGLGCVLYSTGAYLDGSELQSEYLLVCEYLEFNRLMVREFGNCFGGDCSSVAKIRNGYGVWVCPKTLEPCEQDRIRESRELLSELSPRPLRRCELRQVDFDDCD